MARNSCFRFRFHRGLKTPHPSLQRKNVSFSVFSGFLRSTLFSGVHDLCFVTERKVGIKRKNKNPPPSKEKITFGLVLFRHHCQSAEFLKNHRGSKILFPLSHPPLQKTKQNKTHNFLAVFSSLQMPTRPQCRRIERNWSHRSFSSISFKPQTPQTQETRPKVVDKTHNSSS